MVRRDRGTENYTNKVTKKHTRPPTQLTHSLARSETRPEKKKRIFKIAHACQEDVIDGWVTI